jgi:hypothetical protein
VANTKRQHSYGSSIRAAFEKAGKKLNLGKSCLRFRKLDDLPLDVIGDVIAATTPAELIARYEASRKARTPIR